MGQCASPGTKKSKKKPHQNTDLHTETKTIALQSGSDLEYDSYEEEAKMDEIVTEEDIVILGDISEFYDEATGKISSSPKNYKSEYTIEMMEEQLERIDTLSMQHDLLNETVTRNVTDLTNEFNQVKNFSNDLTQVQVLAQKHDQVLATYQESLQLHEVNLTRALTELVESTSKELHNSEELIKENTSKINRLFGELNTIRQLHQDQSTKQRQLFQEQQTRLKQMEQHIQKQEEKLLKIVEADPSEYSVDDQKNEILDMVHTLNHNEHPVLRHQNSITNQEIDNVCAESDLLHIFINTVETTLIGFYVKSELDCLVEIELDLHFTNLQRKFNLAHLARTKSIEEIEAKDVDFLVVLSKMADACGTDMKETEDLLVKNINDLRMKILQYLDHTTAGLENRMHNGFEKYIKLWKNDYTVAKKLDIELDFGAFSFIIHFAFNIGWDQIVAWCAQKGKVLDGHSFVKMQIARDKTLGTVAV